MRITNVAEVAAPEPEALSGTQAQWAAERPAPSERSYAALTPPSDPAAKQSPQAAARPPLIQRMNSERWRMAASLLLSVLIHGWLLSLTFAGQGLGLPGLGFPWQQRRIEVPELRVVLVPAPITPTEPAVKSVAAPAQQASIKPPAAGARAPTPPASPAPPRRRAALEIVPTAKPKAEAKPARNAVARAAPAKASTRPGESRHAVPAKIPKTAAIDVKPSGRRNLVVPAAPTGPNVIAVAPSVVSPETVMPAHRDPGDLAREQIGRDVRARAAELAKQADQLEAARVEAAKLEADRREEAARAGAKRLEAERQEAAQLAAARLEAERQEAARLAAARLETERQEAARLAAARLETERQEAARLAAAQLEAQRQEAAHQEEAARAGAKRLEAERQEAAQLAAARLEAERQEAARLAAARLETERQEAARLAVAQLEAQRQEAARQEEAARVEAKRLEVERQEGARLAAAQLEAQRQEAARGETARLEAERQEAARQAAARQGVARVEAEKEEDARREARRRAIGRQLDEEAAQREATSSAARQLPLTLSTARRARLWGRGDPNVELVRYAEGWARKIQSNTPVETVREVAKQPHTHPMVTVAIRSDGSVESVTFVISSGVAEVDGAIRRIVQSHEHYQAFPPALAREYDVVEIRRTWHFDDAVRLY